ncbi:MAG: discoidin domain-containing protein [Bacillota bacterium]|nr:discoidin domain-containing protein [Bacillota bacterium]
MKKYLILLLSIMVLLCQITPVFADTNEYTYKISGYIKSELQAASSADFKVKIPDTTLTAVTDSYGYFEINVPASQSVSALVISKQTYLERSITNINAASNLQISSENKPIIMWVGDVYQDKAINIKDIMYMAKSFNSTSGTANYNAICDLNADNNINLSDIMLVATHFNISSSSYKAVDFSGAPVNLAKGKKVVASSTGNELYAPENAVDGIMGTKWTTLVGTNQWIYVDLGNKYDINKIVLNYDRVPQEGFKIEFSNNLLDWFIVYPSPFMYYQNTQTIPVSGVCKYIRISFNSNYNLSLYELEVYGDLFLDDYGDSLSEATELTFNNTFNGRINYENDFDCFKFTTNESGNYSISINANDAQYVLIDNLGTYRDGAHVFGMYNSDLTLSPNTTYYVNIFNSQLLSNNNYSLIIKENK